MSTQVPKPAMAPGDLPPDAKIGIVAARFNAAIVEELLAGCLRRLAELNVVETNIQVHHVPGAFELPLAARLMARTRRFDAIICLGCVIRGQTPHFDYVAGECASGIQRVALDEMVPVIFGVLTTNTEQQARERAGGAHGHAGQRAADAAAEMIVLARSLRKYS